MKKNFMRKILGIIISLLLCNTQDIKSQSSASIFQSLKKLEITTTVLYVAAHPDDENTRLITWMSKEKLFRTAYISMTRGDGGQNLIGSDLSENLGLIRTRELMAARAIDGGEQFFTRAYDFGYSKTSEETLDFWEKEKVLEDFVYVIRKIKPDVMICRFPPDNRAGHGHHSSSAILAKEAFEAAANPQKFPEQVKEFGSWQVKRMYWNTFRFGSNNTTTEQQLKVDVGGYNVVDGKSNGELAAESRSQHKSQGFGVPSQRGTLLEYFSPVAGDTTVTDPFENIPSLWDQTKEGNKAKALIQKTITEYNFLDPSASLSNLLLIRSSIKALPHSSIQSQKLKEVELLIKDCIGLWTAAYSFRERYAQGDTIHVTFQSILRNYPEAKIQLLEQNINDTIKNIALVTQKLNNRSLILKGSRSISQPYWLTENHPKGIFTIPDSKQIGKPWNDDPISVKAQLFINNDTLLLVIPVVFKDTDPVKGELFHPLVICPLLTGTLSENKSLFSDSKSKSYALNLQYGGSTDSLITIRHTNLNEDWDVSFNDTSILFHPNDPTLTLPFKIHPIKSNANPNSVTFQFASANGISQELKSNTILNYNHIPRVNWFPHLSLDVQKTDIKIGKKNLLYIKGAGDDVAKCLSQIGYLVEEVNASAIKNLDLKKYDAILTGIRAYNTDLDIGEASAKIFKYIEDGGVYIVQYNTNSNLHPASFKTPYPFSISRNRVTDEHAIVTFTDPSHQIFNTPNKLVTSDFDGWVQERGLYFANKIDSNYTNLLLMNDKDEEPLAGSLILCNYGKGKFIYTGISFFRQLPAGVPGAYRLLANLIAIGDIKK